MPIESPLASDLEAIAHQNSPTDRLDCVIVGAGSCGLTMASTVAEADPSLRVLVLEAGPAPLLTHISNTDLRFSQGLSDRVRDATEVRWELANGGTFGPSYSCLGGRGMFWNGAAPRFRDHDFEGWPLTLSDLEQDYAWAETQFRVTTRLGQTPLAQRIVEKLRDIDINAEPGPFAVDDEDWSPGRLSAGVASGLGIFLRRSGDALAQGQIRLCTNTRVVDLITDDDAGVSGVLARPAGHGRKAMPLYARSVVLAAGAVESIRLALRARIRDPHNLIGTGLQEHHFYRCRFDAPHLFDPAKTDTAVVYVPSTSQDGEQWELHVPGRTLFTIGDGYDWAPAAGAAYQVMLRSFCATDKNAGNGVGRNAVTFNYTAEDSRRRKAMRARAGQICEQLGMISGEPVDAPDRFRPPGNSYHEAGGLDMGTDPATSVTAPDGCFHESPSLVAADAAALPRIGATNPHLTLVALARRKGRELASRLLTDRP